MCVNYVNAIFQFLNTFANNSKCMFSLCHYGELSVERLHVFSMRLKALTSLFLSQSRFW